MPAKSKTTNAAAPARRTSKKLGANRGETAKKTHKRDNNFKQSRDVHEDRGQRQAKSGAPRR